MKAFLRSKLKILWPELQVTIFTIKKPEFDKKRAFIL